MKLLCIILLLSLYFSLYLSLSLSLPLPLSLSLLLSLIFSLSLSHILPPPQNVSLSLPPMLSLMHAFFLIICSTLLPPTPLSAARIKALLQSVCVCVCVFSPLCESQIGCRNEGRAKRRSRASERCSVMSSTE